MNILNFPDVKKGILLCFMSLFIISAHAQQKVLQKINESLKTGTETIRQVGKLVFTTKMTLAELKSVRVVKNSIPISSIPTDQITQPNFKHGKFTNFKWEAEAQFDGEVFPAMILCMSNYKKELNDSAMNFLETNALGFSFQANQSLFIPVKWEIECTDKTFFDKVSGEFVIQDARQRYFFMPHIPWNQSKLAKQVSSTPINVKYRLYDKDGNKEERIQTIFMHSINDCIYRYNGLSFDFLYTAFIQEQHPEVDKILKEALNTKLVKAITGYQNTSRLSDADHTTLQVRAIWNVLHDRGFQYSNISVTSTNDNVSIGSQQVRTFANALMTNQANCVDGTIVFATLLREVGISSVLVMVPKHCFLGYYTSDKPDRQLVYLETTMLSQSGMIDEAKTAKQKEAAYKALFDAANKYATKEFSDYSATNDVKIIDVNFYRDYIRPLPFQ